MEELASVNWLLEQTKRQFQEFNMSKFDQERADITNSSNKSAKRKRPRESLAVLIYQAMQFHRDKLTVASIANFICDKHAYYRTRKHWTITGTIRNALSKDSRFCKISRNQNENKRGCFWALTCHSLWQEILSGNAPIINSEAEFRLELQKRNTELNESTQNSIEPSYSNFTDSDNFDSVEFEDFEMFIKQMDDDAHPWQEDRFDYMSNEWNEWIY